MQGKKKIFIIITILPLFLLFNRCGDKDWEYVPNVYVNFNIDISSGQYAELQLIGGWVYVTGGYRGIILYRKSFDEMMAYDRTSTYKPETEGNKVFVDDNGLIAEDTASGSKFLLLDGSVLEGPASVPLKQYRTTFTGTSLHVYN